MCGIAAIITNDRSLHLSEIITRMTDEVKHRGPDDFGYSYWDTDLSNTEINSNTIRKLAQNHFRAAFGHRRLSILDLSDEGRQPFVGVGMNHQEYTIIYNGEIYNFVELKNELESYGFSFRSTTDTEVLLATYIYWGNECLNKLNGMFSFCIYNEKKHEIFCARDRFGIKPFYYYITPDRKTLLCASEIKQIIASRMYWEKRADSLMLCDYMLHMKSDHTEKTMFANILQLKGGHYLVINLKSESIDLKITSWYSLENILQHDLTDIETAAHQFYSLFLDSSQKRLRSDVEVGACLSGGLDSSSVVSVIAKALQKRLTTLSIVYKEAHLSEERYIDEVVKCYGLKNIKYTPEYDLFDMRNLLERVLYYQDEPFRSASQLSQYEVFNLVHANNIKVVLNGQGGDEVLGGYPSFLLAGIRQNKRHISEIIKYSNLLRVEGSLPKTRLILHLADIYLGEFNLIRQAYHSTFLHPWINSEYLRKYFRQTHPLKIGKNIFEHTKLQITSEFLPQMLHYEDRNSMAFSVESRLPFLDYRLVEFCLSLPDHYKVDRLQKQIIREAMKDILPKNILDRRDKKGFASPGKEWYRFFIDILMEINIQHTDVFHGVDFEELINKKKRGYKFSLPLFNICLIWMWFKRFDIKG